MLSVALVTFIAAVGDWLFLSSYQDTNLSGSQLIYLTLLLPLNLGLLRMWYDLVAAVLNKDGLGPVFPVKVKGKLVQVQMEAELAEAPGCSALLCNMLCAFPVAFIFLLNDPSLRKGQAFVVVSAAIWIAFYSFFSRQPRSKSKNFVIDGAAGHLSFMPLEQNGPYSQKTYLRRVVLPLTCLRAAGVQRPELETSTCLWILLTHLNKEGVEQTLRVAQCTEKREAELWVSWLCRHLSMERREFEPFPDALKDSRPAYTGPVFVE